MITVRPGSMALRWYCYPDFRKRCEKDRAGRDQRGMPLRADARQRAGRGLARTARIV